MKIGDLIRADAQAEFRNDVQLDHIDNPPRNLSLLRSYIFTNAAPRSITGQSNVITSLGLLHRLVNGYLNPREENRLVTIANYGHGKSHLALALANFFGGASDSAEVQSLFQRIRQVEQNESQVGRLCDFKANKGEFLVVRLRGDKAASLREQFPQALERAFREHTASRDATLKLWFAEAERYFAGLPADKVAEADRFLAKHQLDHATFLKRLRERHEGEAPHTSYDLSMSLAQALLGLRPDFGGEADLSQMVQDVAKEWCGNGKPFGGILILFDEFSLYIHRYGQRSAAGELQELLNGVESQQGRVLFLAFAQHDPLSYADTLAAAHGQERDSLKRELTRIPSKYQLYSLMEGVLDAYLKQDDEAWRSFLAMDKVRGSLTQSEIKAFESFRKRYADELGWSLEDFQNKVGKGTFPLHPLTTALLCNTTLQTKAGGARTLLGFVTQEVALKHDEPAVTDGGLPNWVLPTRLADYFGRELAQERYAEYEAALRTAGHDEAPAEEQAALKTMLLQAVAKISFRSDGQVEWLAQAAGLTPGRLNSALESLVKKRAIYRNHQKQYGFWPSQTNPHLLEEHIEKKRRALPAAPDRYPSALQEHLVASQLLAGLIRPLPWGHAEDWKAVEALMTRPTFTVENLRGLIPPYQLGKRIVEGARAALVWLVARNEDDVAWFRDEGAKILDTAFPGESPPPVVVVLPTVPLPELFEQHLRVQALKQFTDEEKKQVGSDFYETEHNRAMLGLASLISGLKGDGSLWGGLPRTTQMLLAPAAYRVTVAGLPRATLETAFDELYKVAYRHRPPEFFTVYSSVGRKNKLRDATKIVALSLLNANHSLRDAVRGKSQAQDLCDKFLISKWQLLGPDYSVREPGAAGPRAAWNYLSQRFSVEAREVNLAEALEPLFNPPYGYDYNTLALLFSAWFGHHAHELQVSRDGKIVSHENLEGEEGLGMGGAEFYLNLSKYRYALRRRPIGQVEKEAQAMLAELESQSTLSQPEAETWLACLAEYKEDSGLTEALRAHVDAAHQRLQEELAAARRYDQHAIRIRREIEGARDIDTLYTQSAQIGELPRLGRVREDTVSMGDLQHHVRERSGPTLVRQVNELSNPPRLADVSLHQQRLDNLSKVVEKLERQDLLVTIQEGEAQLREKEAQLQQRESEGEWQRRIKAMDSRARLERLHAYQQELATFTGLSYATEQLRAEKGRAIASAIETLEQRAAQLLEESQRIAPGELAQAWRERFNRSYRDYEGTQWATKLEAAQARVQELVKFQKQAASIANRPIASPREAEALVAELGSLNATADASTAYKPLIQQAQQRVRQRVADEERKADQRLHSLKRDVEGAADRDLVGHQATLQALPAFLHPAGQAAWQELRANVQARLDRNRVAQIEGLFEAIESDEERAACLRRLQALVAGR